MILSGKVETYYNQNTTKQSGLVALELGPFTLQWAIDAISHSGSSGQPGRKGDRQPD